MAAPEGATQLENASQPKAEIPRTIVAKSGKVLHTVLIKQLL